MNTLKQQWADTFRQHSHPDGPAWLNELREKAAGQLSEHGLPVRKDEAWKYTPMRALEDMSPAIGGTGPANSGIEVALPVTDLLQNPDGTIDMCDGEFAGWQGRKPKGVSVLTLAEGLATHESKLREAIEAVDLSGSTATFSALNTAFLEHGVVIHVDSGVDAGELLMRWTFSGKFDAGMHNARVFLLLERGARLSIIEQFLDNAEQAKALNVITHIELAQEAVLGHVRVQDEPENAVLITSTRTRQAADSEYRYAGFDLGGGLVRHELTSELAGDGAHVSFIGAFVLDGKRHVDNHISVDHAAKNCSSEQFFRGVLGGRSRGVFNGRALIRPGADGSSVRQSNANLLLSELAEIDTKPELEIYADEVEASHGATVGQLDELAIFYLRSRGLSEAAARLMLTGAFCHAVTDKLKKTELAGRIAGLIDEAMPS